LPPKISPGFSIVLHHQGRQERHGAGLSVSYGIVKEHGGEIEVASEWGAGTRFELSFPEPALETSPSPDHAAAAGAYAGTCDFDSLRERCCLAGGFHSQRSRGTIKKPHPVNGEHSSPIFPPDVSTPEITHGHILVIDDEPDIREVWKCCVLRRLRVNWPGNATRV